MGHLEWKIHELKQFTEKEEIRQAIDEIGQLLLEENQFNLEANIEVGNVYEKELDITDGLHWFCSHHHDGQHSELYGIMSELNFKPGPLRTKPENEVGDETYSHLVTLFDQDDFPYAVHEARKLLKAIKSHLRSDQYDS